MCWLLTLQHSLVTFLWTAAFATCIKGQKAPLQCYWCSGKDDCNSGRCNATTSCWQQILPRDDGGYRVDKLCGSHEPTFFPAAGEGCVLIPSTNGASYYASDVVFCKCYRAHFCNNANYLKQFQHFIDTRKYPFEDRYNAYDASNNEVPQFGPPKRVQNDTPLKCHFCQETNSDECKGPAAQCEGTWCTQTIRRNKKGEVVSLVKDCSDVNELTGEAEVCVAETVSEAGDEVSVEACACRSQDFCNSRSFLSKLSLVTRRNINGRNGASFLISSTITYLVGAYITLLCQI